MPGGVNVYIGSASIPSGGLTFGAALPTRLAESSGTTYYVDQSIGSDSNTATQAQNPATPWATVGKAFSTIPTPTTVSGGPRIAINGGTSSQLTYQESLSFSKAGDATHMTTVYGYGSFQPKLKYLSGGQMLNLSGSYVRFRGLDLEGSIVDVSGGPVIVYNTSASCHHAEFDGCRFHDAGSVTAGTSNRWQGTYHDAAVTDVQYWNCRFYNIDVAVAGTARLSHGSYAPGDRIYYINCLVYRCNNGYGLQLYDSANGTQTDLGVYATTIVNCGQSGVVLASRVTNGLIRNAIAAHMGATQTGGQRSGFYGFNNGTAGTNQSCEYSLAYDTAQTAFTKDAASPLTFANNQTGDPVFVDNASDDYHLGAGSAAIGTGDPDYMPATDIDGNARVTADIGCYAYLG